MTHPHLLTSSFGNSASPAAAGDVARRPRSVIHRALISRVAAAACLLPLAWWALRPIHIETASTSTTSVTAPPPRGVAELDVSAFRAPIWYLPPPPPAPAPVLAAPPILPPSCTLLAVVKSLEGHRAVVLDTRANRVVELQVGDRFGEHTVTLIEARGVVLRAGESSAVLSLDPRDPPTMPPVKSPHAEATSRQAPQTAVRP